MLHAMRKRMGDDKGFTLIELMVVVLIIAILIAIAIPTFLGLRSRAQNRSAQSDLRNGLTAGKAFYTDADTYGDGAGGVADFDAAAGLAVEPALDWVGNVTPTAGQVAIKQAAGTSLFLVTLSQSATFYGLGDINGTTVYCKATSAGTIPADAAACQTAGGTSTAAWA